MAFLLHSFAREKDTAESVGKKLKLILDEATCEANAFIKNKLVKLFKYLSLGISCEENGGKELFTFFCVKTFSVVGIFHNA